MGRPSKLSDAQWAEIGRRLANGDGTSALAREFSVSKASISERFSKRTETVKALARKVADTEIEIEQMSIAEQVTVRTLAEKLKQTSLNLATVAENNSAISSRLSEIAIQRLPKVTSDTGTVDREELANVVSLVAASTKAAEVPMALLSMTKSGGPLAEDEGGGDKNHLRITVTGGIPRKGG